MKAKQVNSESVTTAPRPDIPVDIQDASVRALNLANGLREICYCIACSDDGIGPDGGRILGLASDELVEKMKLVDGWISEVNKQGE